MTSPAWTGGAVLGRPDGELRDHLWVAFMVQDRLGAGALPVRFPLAGFPEGIELYPLDPLHQAFLALTTPLLGWATSVGALATLALAAVGIGTARVAAAAGARPVAGWLAGALAMAGPPVLGAFADTQTEGYAIGWAMLLLGELAQPRPRGPWVAAWAVALLLGSPALAQVFAPVAAALFLARRVRGRWLLPILAAAAVVVAGLRAGESGPDGRLHARTGDGTWPHRVTNAVTAETTGLTRSLATVAVSPYPASPTTGPRREGSYALGAALAAAWWLGRRAPARPSAPGAGLRGRARWLLWGTLAFGALAVGSAREHEWTRWGERRVPLPFDLAWRYVPGASYNWKPGTYGTAAWALAAASVGTLPVGAVGGVLAAAAAEVQLRSSTPLPLPATTIAPRQAWTDLDGLPAGALVEFPCKARSTAQPLPGDELLGPLFHGRPLAETHGRGTNPPHRGLLDALAREAGSWAPPETPTLEVALLQARQNEFAGILVHGTLLGADATARLRQALADRRELGASLLRSYPDGDLLFRLDPLP